METIRPCTQGIDSKADNNPSEGIEHGDEKVEHVEIQAETKRPGPALRNVPNGYAEQAGGAHRNQTVKQGFGKPNVGIDDCDQSPDGKEWEPCREDQKIASEGAALHIGGIIARSSRLRLTVRRPGVRFRRKRLAP